MKNTQKVTLDELMDEKDVIKNKKPKSDFKKQYSSFLRKNLKSFFVISFVVAIVVVLVSTIPAVNANTKLLQNPSYEVLEGSILQELWSRMKMLVFTLVSGIVPWTYTAIVGVISYIYVDISDYSLFIVESGYIIGIVKIFIPLLADMITMSLISATAMYLSRISNIKYRLSRLNGTTWTTIKMKFFEMTNNQKKYTTCQEKTEKKRKNLEKENTKINWKMVFINLGVAFIMQLIVVLVKQII